ncbi:MAG TPA: serine hydrolase, partial [Dyella sp.]|nr:serine hydrolase [Dyella sp.]
MCFRPSLRVAIAAALFVAASGAMAQVAPQAATPPPARVDDTARPALPPDLSDFAAYVDSARKTFDVPGIAVAIVKDGKVVMEQGFGDKSLDPKQPVDAHTLFA